MAPAGGIRVPPGTCSNLSWLASDALSLVGLTGVELLDFCCSSVSVFILFYLSAES